RATIGSSSPSPANPKATSITKATELRRIAGSMALLLLAAALGAPAQGKSVFRDGKDCPLMRVLPAGGFIMGSPEREAGRGSAEGPRHRVVIARPFAIGLYDVTRAQFAV